MDEFPGRGHLRDRYFDEARSVTALERALERRPQLLWTARTFGLGADHVEGSGRVGDRDPMVAEPALDLDPESMPDPAQERRVADVNIEDEVERRLAERLEEGGRHRVQQRVRVGSEVRYWIHSDGGVAQGKPPSGSVALL